MAVRVFAVPRPSVCPLTSELPCAPVAPGTPESLRAVRHNGLFWWESGPRHAPTLVLLHGLMAHSMAFRLVHERLAQHYRVVMPDLPGHGRDESFRRPGARPTVQGLLEWLDELTGALGATELHLGGHSLGATISYLAASTPGRLPPLKTLTLVSPGLYLEVPAWSHHLLSRVPARLARAGMRPTGMRLYAPMQWHTQRMSPQEMADYLGPMQDVERLAFMLALTSDLVRQPDRRHTETPVEVPTLVMWGRNDRVLPVRNAYGLFRMLPDARMTIFDACGHCPAEDCPDLFTKTLLAFVAERGI